MRVRAQHVQGPGLSPEYTPKKCYETMFTINFTTVQGDNQQTQTYKFVLAEV